MKIALLLNSVKYYMYWLMIQFIVVTLDFKNIELKQDDDNSYLVVRCLQIS